MRIQKYLAPYGQMKLIEGPHFLQPEVDISVAPNLLKYAVDKSAGIIARMYRPQRTAALTSRDIDRKSTRLNSSHVSESRMPSSA